MTEPLPNRHRFPWRAMFHKASTAVFVVGPARRLRYANPAWEKLAGRPLLKVRGTKVSSRKSTGPLGQVLAPPADAWAGRSVTVRRPVPPAEAGPPWWDLTFVPLMADSKVLGVLGFVTLVGDPPLRGTAKQTPADLGELRKQHALGFGFDTLTGPSQATERFVAQARLAAKTDAPLWLVGEPGTGKEHVARVVHHNGPNREKAFVGVDCAGVQPYLVESLLVGKGGLALSGTVGTLYLKGPAALPRDLQDRLAELFVHPRPGMARLVSGSNRVALDGVKAGTLIAPFHTALSVLELRVPSLKDRKDDLPKLIDKLLDRIATGSKPKLVEDVLTVLKAYDWPGNVRELADVLDQAIRRAGDGLIKRDHLPRGLREKFLVASNPPTPAGPVWTLDGVLEAVEKRLIELALRKAGNSQTDAAAALGIFRARLGRRIEALKISVRTPNEGG